jgi:hypothetical protein
MKKNYAYPVSLWFVFFGAAGTLGAQTPTPTATFDCCQSAVTQWLGQGSGAGATIGASNFITMDNSRGIFYQADAGNNVIQVFNQSGGAVSALGTAGEFSQPNAIFLATDGYLYVGDYIGQDIKKVDPATNQVPVTLTGVGSIRGLFVDGGGVLYAALEGGVLQVYTPNGAGGYTLAKTFSDPTHLSNTPNQVLVDVSAGVTTVYVADSGNGDVLQYSVPSGYDFTYAQVAAVVSGGPYEITRDGAGNFYATSFGDGRYDVYDPHWNLLYACQPGYTNIGIGVDAGGNIYLAGSSGPLNQTLKFPHCSAIPLPQAVPVSQPCYVYPSPVRGDKATLAYTMIEPGRMKLEIWNQNGERVSQVTDVKPAGAQTTVFSLAHAAPGVYFYTVSLSYDSGKIDARKPGKFVVLR